MVELMMYQIQVKGRISERWAHWFEDMSMTVHDQADAPAITTLTGPVTDQAALAGLLQTLYTLGLPLLLVRKEEVAGIDESDSQ